MEQCSSISYYYAFPQLVRFMKDENPVKKPMDEFYAESLYNLKVNKQFVIHTKDTYGVLMSFMQNVIS